MKTEKSPAPLHWKVHEYEDRDRSSDWYWAVGILTVAIALTSIILGNVLFALVVILGGFALTLYAARRPDVIDIVINDKGVRIHNVFYPFHTLESFWVEDLEINSKVLIKSQKLFMPYIILPIAHEDDVPDIKKYLSRHLPEVFHSESVFHRVMEYLGF